MTDQREGHPGDFDEVALFEMIDADLNVAVWVRAVALQHQRLRDNYASLSWEPGKEVPVDEVREWTNRQSADALMFVLATEQLAGAARALRHRVPSDLVADVDDAVARFNEACPDRKNMRDAIVHMDDYLLGRGRRGQGAKPHVMYEFESHSLVLSVDKQGPWLEMDFDAAASAASELAWSLDAVAKAAFGATASQGDLPDGLDPVDGPIDG